MIESISIPPESPRTGSSQLLKPRPIGHAGDEVRYVLGQMSLLCQLPKPVRAGENRNAIPVDRQACVPLINGNDPRGQVWRNKAGINEFLMQRANSESPKS